MLSIINLVRDYNENKRKIYAYFRGLDKKDIYKIYKNLDQYEKDVLYKNLSKETLISMITIILHRLKYDENMLIPPEEFEYKGKCPEKHKKNISKIAEQLDKNGKY